MPPPHRHSVMDRKVARVQCRELRTPSYVSACSSDSRQNGPPGQAYPEVSALTVNPENLNPARLAETASHFPGIGVISAQ
jgi:hypothetical protein